MKEIILITGANGMVAKRLSEILNKDYSIKFLTRKKTNYNEYEWNAKKGYIDIRAFQNVKHIIHLAGSGIANKRWSKKRKKTIISSRVNTAKLILETLNNNNIKISSFISASAVGYYGTETTENIYTEESENGNDFLSTVCSKWEQIANKFSEDKISERTVILRIGITLSKKGGALKKMLNPVKLYVGASLGSGKQYLPWIHIDDLCSIIKYSIDNASLNGTYNAVSPEHITNKEFTKTLAKFTNKPILLPNIPDFILKMIFGEVSVLLLKGSRVSSKKIIESGYKFKYPDLIAALIGL